MKTKLNKETEEINEEMSKDVKDACEPAAPLQVILKKAKKVVLHRHHLPQNLNQ